MTKTEINKTLGKAAKLIEEHGWCQHTNQNNWGEYCLIGACLSTKKEWEDFLNPPNEIMEELRQRIKKSNIGIDTNPIAWNDEEGRTEEEVINLLRRAAE